MKTPDHPTGGGEVCVVACGAPAVAVPTTTTRRVVPFLLLTSRVVAVGCASGRGGGWRVQASAPTMASVAQTLTAVAQTRRISRLPRSMPARPTESPSGLSGSLQCG